MKRVLLISGSMPPLVCGVGDYTSNLSSALSGVGLEVEVLTTAGAVPAVHADEVAVRARVGGWGPSHAATVRRAVEAVSPDVVHLQYPTAEYGAGLLPQMLVLLKVPFVVTIHEASISHVLRRASLYPFLMFADRVVATTSFEASYLARMYPPAHRKLSVIPVGSNVPAAPDRPRSESVAYFGLVAPNKGLEDFLKVAELSRKAGETWEFSVVGTPARRREAYAESLRAASRGLPVAWFSGLPFREVAEHLAGAGTTYLPFPDGASLRRASLLAALANASPVVTTRGQATPDDMLEGEHLLFADSPEAAYHRIKEVFSRPALARRLSRGAAGYAKQFSWPRIAARHVALYESMRQKPGSEQPSPGLRGAPPR